MVAPAGFEPATLGLEVLCSIQLSYGATPILYHEDMRTPPRYIVVNKTLDTPAQLIYAIYSVYDYWDTLYMVFM